MKKKFKLLPVFFALLLSACNGGGGSTPSDPKPSDPTPTDPTPTDPTPTDPAKKEYSISFYNEDGSLLATNKVEENQTPSYTYNKADTAEWDYTFEGWSSSKGGEVLSTIPTATANASYYAIVSKVKRSYKTTFYDEDGIKLDEKTLEYGATPSYTYGKQNNAEYIYEFNGWATTKGGSVISSIPSVSGNASYYANVTKTKKQYKVTFYDENGNKLEEKNWDYGTTPSYSYTKTATKEYTYTTTGWATAKGGTKVTIPKVTGEASYYALVSATKNKYTITFNSNSGSAVSSITEDYGTSVNKPTDPTRDDYNFVAWCSDQALTQAVSWPYELKDDVTFYAKWNEKIKIKEYLQTLISATGHDPYSYIPEAMKPSYSNNNVKASDVTYDFNNFVNVSSVKYGGFGEQWNMVIDNIRESEKFYAVLTAAETVINTSVAVFNNYLDSNPSATSANTSESGYTAYIDFKNNILTYTLKYSTGWSIPFFGTITPQIDMTYNVSTLEKAVRIQLTENNAMRYVVTENKYLFGIEYGISTVSRKAYCQMTKNQDGSIQGNIYEFIQFKDKDLVPACADFYINNEYVSAVGNKASGLVGFTGYIDELYKTNEGKLLGYEVRETFEKWTINKTYNTLWFNLNNISGITNIKAVDTGNGYVPGDNQYEVYLNNSSSIFTPQRNSLLFVSTSRKYDVELRKQYFYEYDSANQEYIEHQVLTPMMFIQEENYDTFVADMAKSGVSGVSVTMNSTDLAKVKDDYDTLVDIFIANKDTVDSTVIQTWIGSAVAIA